MKAGKFILPISKEVVEIHISVDYIHVYYGTTSILSTERVKVSSELPFQIEDRLAHMFRDIQKIKDIFSFNSVPKEIKLNKKIYTIKEKK